MKPMHADTVQPPDELDGAKVIKWMWSGKVPFGHMEYSDSKYPAIEIYGLAICQYEDTLDIYQFSCDKNWEVQNDSPHDSIESAMVVSDQYKNVLRPWIDK